MAKEKQEEKPLHLQQLQEILDALKSMRATEGRRALNSKISAAISSLQDTIDSLTTLHNLL